MNPFEMVVLIVAIVMIARVVITRNQQRSITLSDVRLNELTAEVARLRERVQTLERLAIDPSRRLADEIDALSRDR